MVYLAVALGGALGSCLRYAITQACNSYGTPFPYGTAFPYGTLISNIVAGLLIGFVLGLDRELNMFAPKAKLFLTTGVMGGLSTFSTFSVESIDLFRNGQYLLSSANVMLNLAFSFTGVVAGMALAGIIAKKAL